MTNAEKFEKVFGFKPDGLVIENCPFPATVCKACGCLKKEKVNKDTIYRSVCEECDLEDWWDHEYKGCFKIREDLQ